MARKTNPTRPVPWLVAASALATMTQLGQPAAQPAATTPQPAATAPQPATTSPAAPAPTAAEQPAAPTAQARPPRVLAPRSGLMLGFSLGAGDIDCDGCDAGFDAFGAAVHVGAMITPRLAVMGELWVMRHAQASDSVDADLTLVHTITTASAQLWLLPRLWIKAGLGAGRASVTVASPNIDIDASKNGPAFAIAAGYELVVGQGLAADIQIRAGTGLYSDAGDPGGSVEVEARNVAVGAGLTWF